MATSTRKKRVVQRKVWDKSRIHASFEMDGVCCGIARLYGIQGSRADLATVKQKLMYEAYPRNLGGPMLEQRAKAHIANHSATKDECYAVLVEKIKSWNSRHSQFLISDNVNSRNGKESIGISRGSYVSDEINCWDFTNYLRRKRIGTITEGPVTFNPNHTSYVQMRIWTPPWAEEQRVFKNFREFDKARAKRNVIGQR